ncbi:MAG: hypothetical protein WDA09_10435 [Bacteriovoracaceae bacterium]
MWFVRIKLKHKISERIYLNIYAARGADEDQALQNVEQEFDFSGCEMLSVTIYQPEENAFFIKQEEAKK